jgi:hypothetical protein
VTDWNYNNVISTMNEIIIWVVDRDYYVDCKQKTACTILFSAYVCPQPKNTDNRRMVLLYAEISILITFSSTFILSEFMKSQKGWALSSAKKDLITLVFIGSTAVLARKSLLKQLEKPMKAMFPHIDLYF